MKLPPYPEYKESGQPDVGMIPAHWDVFRNGRLFEQRNETGFGDLPILEVSLKTGVRVRDMENLKRKQVMSDREKYKRAAEGDIAYNMMRMWQGAVGVAPTTGLVSPAYVVVSPFSNVDVSYYAYLFRTAAYMNEIDAYSRGIVKDRNRLYWQDFKRMPSVVPPIEEQRQISRYLNSVENKIKRFIRNKLQLIKLLKEQKQNVINQAVTRGLNPDVKLKPSGVDWVGDIPEHWNIRRAKFLSNIKTGGRDTVDQQENGKYPFYVRSQTIENIDTYSFDGEAVLTAGDGAGVAKVFHYVNGKFDYHQRVYKFSHFRDVTGKFFFHYFKGHLHLEAFRETAKSTVDSLRLPMLQNFPVPLPPINEQNEIVANIENETALIDQTITRAEREIELMREYRDRLVSDVVTGKVDVRAVILPDTLTELDEIEEAAMDDESLEDCLMEEEV